MPALPLMMLTMHIPADYQHQTLTRDHVDALPGALVLEFGTGWCGYCRAAQAVIASGMAASAENLSYYKVEDGKGKRLGRSFAVKLWPTLIFIQDGQEVARLVRPEHAEDVRAAANLLQR